MYVNGRSLRIPDSSVGSFGFNGNILFVIFTFPLMRHHLQKIAIASFFLFFLSQQVFAGIDRIRCMWRSDPATTMVIGWDQITGSNPVVMYGPADRRRPFKSYPFSRKVDRVVTAKDQNNYFARLSGLIPDTRYNFVIRDSEGTSRIYSFRTAPASPDQKLSIIAGGDSRNFRGARQRANRLVAKLRPHFVLFAGDMTGGDSGPEWIEWLNDWQLTITDDGQLTPIVVARGNHEVSNETLFNLFDLPNPDNYFTLSFGGELLRVYSLNSNISSKGDQLNWLKNDLQSSQQFFWKIVQYHHPMRPHTINKMEQNNLYTDWAGLFFQYGVNLAVECDAHVVKCTWPIRPSWEAGSQEGFIRDDLNGTVYMGEGGWGAPLRPPNDIKSWTRVAGSFNQIQWIFLDRFQMEIRIVPTDQVEMVGRLREDDRFQIPENLQTWNPSGAGPITLLRRPNTPALTSLTNGGQAGPGLAGVSTNSPTAINRLEASAYGAGIRLQWVTAHEPKGMTYTIQRRLRGETSFSTLHTFAGYPGTANLHQYVDTELKGTAPNTWVEYRVNGLLPNGILKMYTVNAKRPSVESLRPALPKLEFTPGTQKVSVPISLTHRSDIAALFINERQEEVLRLFFPALDPGNHRKNIDLSNLPPGTYLIQLQANTSILDSYLLDNP